ncbi:MAG: hypothetical protein HRS57_02075 [Mycoplasmataceae bacterium]|nr:hypothetical protein [Mycoplasmataceae bacterium]
MDKSKIAKDISIGSKGSIKEIFNEFECKLSNNQEKILNEVETIIADENISLKNIIRELQKEKVSLDGTTRTPGSSGNKNHNSKDGRFESKEKYKIDKATNNIKYKE